MKRIFGVLLTMGLLMGLSGCHDHHHRHHGYGHGHGHVHHAGCGHGSHGSIDVHID